VLLQFLPHSSFAQVDSDPLEAVYDETRSGETFVRIYPNMESALDVIEEQRELPDKTWIGRDKRSAQKDLNVLLDEVIDAFDIEDVRSFRSDISEAREKIKASRELIAEYRRERIRAPADTTLGMDGLPFFVTKKGYDDKIAAEEKKIRRYQKFITSTKKDFISTLKKLGIKVSGEEFEVLSNTVNGDEFIDLKVAFETVRSLTVQLEKLTQESGEDIETAKKYFGMYTVLLRILDRLQTKFVEDIDEKHLPKLKDFTRQAEKNISEAESAIEEGGNRLVLEQNIKSNQLTLKALDLYVSYLQSQRADVIELNSVLQSDILTADSTYNTVALANQVVTLLRTGIKNYESLMKLNAPSLLGFENKDLRREIVELTQKMRDQ
jgi:hypothetical protein